MKSLGHKLLDESIKRDELIDALFDAKKLLQEKGSYKTTEVKVIPSQEYKDKKLKDFIARPEIQSQMAQWDAHHRRPNVPYLSPPIIFSDSLNDWMWVSRTIRRKSNGN